MNPTTALLLLLIVASTFIFPAAAISYAHAASATVIINQPNAKTFKCIDPTGKTQTCPDGSVIDISATCPSTTNIMYAAYIPYIPT